MELERNRKLLVKVGLFVRPLRGLNSTVFINQISYTAMQSAYSSIVLNSKFSAFPSRKGVSASTTRISSFFNRLTAMNSQPEKQESQQPTKKWDEYHSRWEDIWTGEGSGAKLQPGQLFDQGRSPPILPTLLTKGTVNVQGKRCLVPGCGRGYDVATFAKFGAAESVGLELAPSALEAAAAYLASEASLTPEEKARTRLVAGDFFAFSETFDVAFDYTFLCALHPDMRPAWATTYARMIKPGGILVTLVYPMDREKPRDSGPPFPLFPEDYEILKPAGFELVSMERVPDVLSHPPRVGKENIGIWRRK